MSPMLPKLLLVVLALATGAFAPPPKGKGPPRRPGGPPGGWKGMPGKGRGKDDDDMEKMLPMMMMKPKPMPYFISSGPNDDCSNVPDDVEIGDPMKEACADMETDSTVCVCSKKPVMMLLMMQMSGNDLLSKRNVDNGFVNVCGKCKDPCSLRWKPDMMKPMEGPMGESVMDMMEKIMEGVLMGKRPPMGTMGQGGGEEEYGSEYGEYDG